MRNENFIQDLVKDFEPKHSPMSPQLSLLLWMIVTFFVLMAGVLLVSLRRDIGLMLEMKSFHFELFSALSLGLVAAGTAIHMRVPGNHVPRRLLGVIGGIWIISLIYHAYSMKASAPFSMKLTINCMVSIAALSLLPGGVLYFLVKRGATTEPRQTFAIVGMAMTAATAAFIPLSCGTDALPHLMLGHAGPVFLFGFIFWFIGPSLLRW